MALKHDFQIGIITRTHLFDSVKDADLPTNWQFKYETKNADGTDATIDKNKPLQEKDQYPPKTIFLDSDQDSFILYSAVSDIFIDNYDINLVSQNIQYTAIMQDFACSITVESRTPIDVQNIAFGFGPVDVMDNMQYEVSRKKDSFLDIGTIKNIVIDKDGDYYTISFKISKSCVDQLNQKQLYLQLWNIAGNTFNFYTDAVWTLITTSYNIHDLTQLKIVFIDPIPDNRIVYDNIVGKVTVKVYNPNPDFITLQPKFKLLPDSLGVIDTTTISYNALDGVLTFDVINIRDTGYVHVAAWLDIPNTELTGALKNATYAEGLDGEWCGATEGRLIKFKQNVPLYLKNDNYASFVQMTQDFMNTLYTSMSNDKQISILEKIARINNFNDVKTIETKLLENYKNEYNISVDPNLDVYKSFLEAKKVNITEETVQTNTPEDESESLPNNGRMMLRRAMPLPRDGEDPTDTDPTTDNPADADWSLDNENVKQTFKNFVYQDISGDELYGFIKNIYKNIPYYNQMAGTYRGITFILDQLSLCVKLVEIWSDRNINNNFDHNELQYREDELNAVRSLNPSGNESLVGRLYLTSRFDVDVMESGLTFEKFNEISFNIVKLILEVKPIHRVLRKLSYVFVANTDLQFQYFLLDNLSMNSGTALSDGNCGIKLQKFCYVWDLFDPYAASKAKYTTEKTSNVESQWTISVDRLFVPFTAIDAQVSTENRPLYNDFGEYKDDLLTGAPKKFIGGKYDGLDKPITEKTDRPEMAAAVKNTYHNLHNFQTKVNVSKLTKLTISFLYVDNFKYRYPVNHLTASDNIINEVFNNTTAEQHIEMTTFDSKSKTFKHEITIDVPSEDDPTVVEEQTVLVTQKLYDVLLGRNEDITFDESNWKTYTFNIGTNLEIESATNGFYLIFKDGAKTIFNEIGLTGNFNQQYHYNGGPTGEPIALLCKIDNLRIPLGTDFIMQSDN